MDRKVERGDRRDGPDLGTGLEAMRRSPAFRGPVAPPGDHEPATENDHLALLYEDREEQFDAVVPFVRQGLERGEKCLYVAHENAADEVEEAMRARGIDVDAAIESGALSILTAADTYRRNGGFDRESMMAFLEDAIERATDEEGYAGFRVTAEMSWALDSDTPTADLIEYDACTNDIYRDTDLVGLCQYDRERFPPGVVHDVVRTHPHLVHDGAVYHNVYYTPPEEFFGPENPGREVDRMLSTLREQTETTEALQERERQFSAVMDNIPGMVYRCRNERGWPMDIVDGGFEDLTGYDAGELKSGELSFGADVVHDEDREELWEEVQRGLEEDGSFLVTYRVTTVDGEVRWVRERGRGVYDDAGNLEALEGVIVDVTEPKRLEVEFEEMLGRITDAFYAVDEEFRFTHVNERAAELLQRPKDELIGEQLWEIYPEAAEMDEVWESFHTALNEQEPTSYEVYFPPLDFWVEATLYPSATGVSVYFRDVTEQKERERELERTNEQLKKSNERLEEFAYAASHDLKEPLRMVSSYLSLIDDRYADDLDDDAEEFLEFAVDGAERMRDMIDGLLAYSRVETQADPFEPVDLNAVLEDVLADLRLQIEETDAEVTIDDLPRIEGDPDQLRQLFQNLLDNAIEYSGDGPPRVHVSARREGSEWILSVRDEGIGMDPDDADRVFEVFQRLHSQDEHPGTGIGLALCERIAERHGGDIRVDTEPGAGATFSLTLPADR